ncbi:hypothetical protein CTI12_AA256920 [Artemisia annua]|uniref:Uncharacterized protein n=1 Tax=Artemisia annua TaxID=35608 RepID=A0A2U1NKC2_ARTAN|nr:hypothetical protein CTI12_AA256920 [Artemisia annua]
MDIPSRSETDSNDDAGAEIEYDRLLNVGILESLKSFYITDIVRLNLNTDALLTVIGLARGNLYHGFLD